MLFLAGNDATKYDYKGLVFQNIILDELHNKQEVTSVISVVKNKKRKFDNS